MRLICADGQIRGWCQPLDDVVLRARSKHRAATGAHRHPSRHFPLTLSIKIISSPHINTVSLALPLARRTSIQSTPYYSSTLSCCSEDSRHNQQWSLQLHPAISTRSSSFGLLAYCVDQSGSLAISHQPTGEARLGKTALLRWRKRRARRGFRSDGRIAAQL